MKIKIFPIFLLIIFFIIFFVFYKGLQKSNIYIPTNNVEKKIPNFDAKIFNTDIKINSEEIFEKDKFYLLNIWASWCIPCRDEHLFLMNLSTNKNLEIIGLNYKDNNKQAKMFLKKFDSPYKLIFSDDDGIIAIDWGAYGVPETFLIYNKKIIKKIIGPLNEVLLLEIKELIK
jgi:cytochrome c biogenesis protein CcmG/thiol:disulfide interchange protein DsbE|tara:strand:+ start:823 stop:1341 length:519 start_codon:yes stop_codon:yes gene_type:complete